MLSLHMVDYPERFDQTLGGIEAKAENTEDEFHSEILWNYLHHASLEYGEVLEPAFEADLFVDEPRYVFYMGEGGEAVFEGEEAVKEDFYVDTFYEIPFSACIYDEVLFVEDWGLGSYHTSVSFPTGEHILDDPDQFGIDWDSPWDFDEAEIDPDQTYIAETKSSMFWPFDENAKLVGEEVFNRKPDDVREPNEDDVVLTKEERTDIAKQYWPEDIKAELEA